MTMNDQRTSATFAPASPLYYHFSRYFDTRVQVPVSVFRTMDRQQHLERVALRGLAAPGASAMNRAGWEILAAADREPSSYRPTDELFTADRRQLFGVLLNPQGKRYGAEINGTRKSGWGAGQNRDFQQTAPFRALRADAPLLTAIALGIQQAKQDPDLRKALPEDPSIAQMLYWMQEITELATLDFIFSQQDRIGNIDYLEYWHWVADGAVQRQIAQRDAAPPGILDYNPIRLRRSWLNDNDAGGRLPYANFAKTTGMLENLAHFSAATYRKLQQLAADLESAGAIFHWLRNSFGLSDRQIRQIVVNADQAASILRQGCMDGRVRFDLDPARYLTTDTVREQKPACTFGN
jgi:hypothetical protein